jgi:cytochrome c
MRVVALLCLGVLAACSQPAPSPATPVAPRAAFDPVAERGRELFKPCRACHVIAPGAPHRVGPNLHGVFGREAGTAPGFAYSQALTGADFVWTAERLDAWLADPKGYLSGSSMSFPGVPDPKDRADLIAWLEAEAKE